MLVLGEAFGLRAAARGREVRPSTARNGCGSGPRRANRSPRPPARPRAGQQHRYTPAGRASLAVP